MKKAHTRRLGTSLNQFTKKSDPSTSRSTLRKKRRRKMGMGTRTYLEKREGHKGVLKGAPEPFLVGRPSPGDRTSKAGLLLRREAGFTDGKDLLQTVKGKNVRRRVWKLRRR